MVIASATINQYGLIGACESENHNGLVAANKSVNPIGLLAASERAETSQYRKKIPFSFSEIFWH